MRVVLALIASIAFVTATPKPATFFARQDYLGPNGAQLVRVADVNGDKIPDIIASNVFTSNIEVLLGNGNGSFRTGPTSMVGLQPGGIWGMALLDLNHDGVTDLIVAGAFSSVSGIGVCFGNGDGTFQPAVQYQAGGDGALDLALGDVNGDGIPDAITIGYTGVWVFLGKGGGVFNAGVLTPLNAPSTVHGVVSGRLAAADFTGHGHLDLAVTIDGTPGGFILLPGNGDGTFGIPVTFNVPPYGGQNYIAAADLNGNHRPDVLLSPLSSE